jgi:hypothetical protein
MAVVWHFLRTVSVVLLAWQLGLHAQEREAVKWARLDADATVAEGGDWVAQFAFSAPAGTTLKVLKCRC